MREHTSRHDIPVTPLSNWDLLRVGLRLFFVQSAWTLSTMQTEGFVYALSPALRKMFPNEKRLRRILKHYQTPINTHPLMLGIMGGITLRMEHEGHSTRTIMTYLRSTMGPLAALGDPFFYSALTPTTAAATAVVALAAGPWWAIGALLVVMNCIHLTIRIGGVFWGYRNGHAALTRIGHWIDADKTRGLRIAGSIATGAMVALVARILFGGYSSWIPIAAGGTTVVGALLVAAVFNLKREAWIYALPAALLLLLLMEVVV